jgi:hypothetical protein
MHNSVSRDILAGPNLRICSKKDFTSAFRPIGKIDDCQMQIKVKTISRLHFGVIDYIEATDSFKGSLGVALEWPNTVLAVNENSDLLIKSGNRKKNP